MPLPAARREDINLSIRDLVCDECDEQFRWWRCRQCDHELDDSDEVCLNCDEDLSKRRLCPSCGSSRTRPMRMEENFKEKDKPVSLLPIVKPVIEAVDELGRDMNGSPLYSEKIEWLRQHGLLEDQSECSFYLFVWSTYFGEVNRILAKQRDVKPDGS